MIIKLAESTLQTKYGTYQEILYYDGQKEINVMILGAVTDAEKVICRVHSSCIYGHYFNSIECHCREEMEYSQQIIQQEGRGIIFLLDQEGKANGHFALMQSKIFKQQGLSQSEAYEAAGFKKDARDFSKVADILKELSVKSIYMLTDSTRKVEILTQFGIEVVGIQKIVTPE